MAAAVESENKVEEKKSEKGESCCYVGQRVGMQSGGAKALWRAIWCLPLACDRSLASTSASCHCVALDVEGRCYTWGRNERGQLGHGDKLQRDRPTFVSELSKYKIIRAGSGRSHSVVVSEDGQSLAFGWNKHGQLGSGSVKNEVELSPVRCLVSEVKTVACGAEFTVWLSSAEGASILTAGLPQYGQLGHGTDNEYNSKDSSVRLAYEPQPRPKAIASLSGETIVKVACGTNHTVAVDSSGHVYTWGFGGYGRLGHREQKDEWVPRRVEVFQRQNVLPPEAVISAGSVNSSCTAGGGQLYMWGKIKITGDDWMYPKPLMDLSDRNSRFSIVLKGLKLVSGWHLNCMDSGNMHHFVGADSSCISWGHAQYGELGYGPNGQKSSAVPKKVDILEGMHVITVACGFGNSMVVVDRTNVGDRLDQSGSGFKCVAFRGLGWHEHGVVHVRRNRVKEMRTWFIVFGTTCPCPLSSSFNPKLELDIYDGKAAGEGSEEPESLNAVPKKTTKKGAAAAKSSENSKKRKKSKESSDSESEEDYEDNDSDDSEVEVNGEAEKKRQRGGKASGRGRGKGAKKPATGKKDSGRGRGRPLAVEKTSQHSQGKGKRGRPRK
ncbi:Protein RCC2-like [Vitis vinifera]|uniref:Protein RCC2-like n=1 Tax=Vitis vinifera TaxID=29760 RepID=A0A438K1N1_VITVI|nr:Protein RCC2-like [Vitis vinifera]